MTPADYGLLIALLTVAAAPLAWSLTRTSRRLWPASTVLALALIGLGMLARKRPDLLTPLGPSPAVVWLHGCLFSWGGLMLMGGCLPLLRRRAEYVMAAGFCLISTFFLAAFPMRLAVHTFRDLSRKPAGLSYPQSTGWSCGPAAAASFLAQMGVRADEAGMARLCGTIPGRGTSDYGLWSGVRASLPLDDFDVELISLREHTLDELPTPALISIHPFMGADHSLVVVCRFGTGILLADPASRHPCFVTPEELTAMWHGSAVIVRPLARVAAQNLGTGSGLRSFSRNGGNSTVGVIHTRYR